MYYYKTILPNGKEEKFSSFSFIRYVPEKDWFVGCSEPTAEYITLDGEGIYRIPWLKYEPAKLKGKYPVVNAEYITEEEFLQFQEEKRKQREEENEKARLLAQK